MIGTIYRVPKAALRNKVVFVHLREGKIVSPSSQQWYLMSLVGEYSLLESTTFCLLRIARNNPLSSLLAISVASSGYSGKKPRRLLRLSPCHPVPLIR